MTDDRDDGDDCPDPADAPPTTDPSSVGLDDAAALRAVDAIPERFRSTSLLYQFVRYGFRFNRAPAGYYAMVALPLLAACAPVSLRSSPDAFLEETNPNVFVLVVGPSGSKKTRAINLGRRLLAAANPGCIGDDPGSEEALYKQLHEKPTQVIVYPEFAQLLSNTSGGKDNYREKIRDALTGWFDGIDQGRRKVKTRTPVENPRLSLLGGCTPRHLEDRTTLYDWEGGHNSRYIVYYHPERAQRQLWGQPDPAMEQWLIGQLQARSTIQQAGRCLGMTPDAKTRWAQWNEDVESRTDQVDERLAGAVSRLPLHAAKIAILLSWDYGGAAVGPWAIDLNVIEPAIALTELHLRSVLLLAQRIAATPDARWMNALVNAVPPGPSVALGEILERVPLAKKQALLYLETLTERRKLKRLEPTSVEGSAYYQRQEDGDFAPYVGPVAESAPPTPAFAAQYN